MWMIQFKYRFYMKKFLIPYRIGIRYRVPQRLTFSAKYYKYMYVIYLIDIEKNLRWVN